MDHVQIVNNRNMLIASLLLLSLGTMHVYADGAGIEWDILNQEANDLSRQGECTRAVVVAKEAIYVAVENVGWQHSDVATSLNNLASLYYTQGDYAKAKAQLGWEPKVGFEDLVREMVDADLARLQGR